MIINIQIGLILNIYGSLASGSAAKAPLTTNVHQNHIEGLSISIRYGKVRYGNVPVLYGTVPPVFLYGINVLT